MVLTVKDQWNARKGILKEQSKSDRRDGGALWNNNEHAHVDSVT